MAQQKYEAPPKVQMKKGDGFAYTVVYNDAKKQSPSDPVEDRVGLGMEVISEGGGKTILREKVEAREARAKEAAARFVVKARKEEHSDGSTETIEFNQGSLT